MTQDIPTPYREAVRRTIEFIDRQMGQPLSVRELANVACFSPQHFQRIFATATGESVMDHVRRRRIERAAMRLTETDDAIATIAFGAGYRTHESFTRAFRSIYDLSPSEFRKQAKLCAYHRGIPNPLEWLIGELSTFASLAANIVIQDRQERKKIMSTHTTIDHEIDTIVEEIEALKKKLSEAQRKRPREKMPEYRFEDASGGQPTLAELFGDKQDLILIHNMGTGCPYCTLWADGFNGFTEHLNNRAAFVLTSNDKPDVQKRFAEKRGWRFKMVSSHGTSFFKDLGFETEDGIWPGVSTFHKDADGQVYRVGRAVFGPGDDYCAIWGLFDLLDGGHKDWEPKYSYSE